MEVPSSEIAKNCSDTSPAALKKLGVDFNCLRLTTWPAASNSTRESVVGVRKSVTVSHRSSLSRESTAPTPIDPVAGKSGKARRVKPSRPGEIGRASCRERVEVRGGAGGVSVRREG